MVPSKMHLSVTALRYTFGFLAYYTAAFVREDEERHIQNLLETWWIRLMYTRDRALSKAATFMTAIAKLADRTFDVFLGRRLWSLQSVGVSLFFSSASFCMGTLVTSYFVHRAIPPDSRFHLFIYSVVLIAVAVLPSLVGRLAFLIWGVFIAIYVAPVVIFLIYAVHKLWGSASLFRLIATLVLLLIGGMVSNVAYIALTRWMIRRAMVMTRVIEIIAILAVDCALALLLLYAPIEVGSFLMSHLNLEVGFGVILVFMLNCGDIAACAVFFIIMIGMLLHRLVWPVLERPLYASQRYGLVRKKVTLWTVGSVLIFGPPGFAVVKAIAERL
jgi:hypothetical protein